MKRLQRISRRAFLQQTGRAGGGLVLAMSFSTACGRVSDEVTVVDDGAVAPNVYVNLRNDGNVEIYCHRSEMGQGIRTSLPQEGRKFRKGSSA